jgi:hypothetical protein
MKQAAVTQMKPVPAGTPDEEVSVSELMKRLSSEREKIGENDEYRAQVQVMRENVAEINGYIENTEFEISELNKSIDAMRRRIEEYQTEKAGMIESIHMHEPVLASLIDPDTSVTEKAIQDSDEINKAVRAKKEAARILAEARRAEKELEVEKTKLTEKDQVKRDALKEARFPIDGLSFDDTGVLHNGIPFTQISTSQKIKISVAMGMAMNPKLRVMFIRDGSFLDSQSMKDVEEIARETDFQFWIERVDESGKTGFIIEDGTARAAAEVQNA